MVRAHVLYACYRGSSPRGSTIDCAEVQSDQSQVELHNRRAMMCYYQKDKGVATLTKLTNKNYTGAFKDRDWAVFLEVLWTMVLY